MVSQGEKVICGTKIAYYNIRTPLQTTNYSVERWRWRAPITRRLLADVSVPVAAGTFVEVRLQYPGATGSSPAIEGWAAAKLEESYHPGVGDVKVTYYNSSYLGPKKAVSIQEIALIPDNDASTKRIWKPSGYHVSLVSDVESQMPTVLKRSVDEILAVDTRLPTLTAAKFEPHRDQLIEGVHKMLLTRNYSQAIAVIEFLRQTEHFIATKGNDP